MDCQVTFQALSPIVQAMHDTPVLGGQLEVTALLDLECAVGDQAAHLEIQALADT